MRSIAGISEHVFENPGANSIRRGKNGQKGESDGNGSIPECHPINIIGSAG
jgi:hypothetical protein